MCCLPYQQTSYSEPHSVFFLEVEDDPDDQHFFDASTVTMSDIIQYEVNNSIRHPKPIQLSTSEPDYEKQRPLFAWLPTETIKKTYELSTQYARLPMSTLLKKRYQSPNPALNVHRRSESVATDTIYSDTPAVDSGVTQAQCFVGCKTMVCDAYPMKTDKQFVNTLEDNIRTRGAMDRLVSDSA